MATEKPASRAKESIRTWLRLLSCETHVEQRLRAYFRDNFSVTLPQFDVLSELERARESLTMSQLSDELMVSNGNITGVIDRLEKVGYVRRVRSLTDRRIQHIELTDTGLKEFKAMARKHEKQVRLLFADLSLGEMSQLQKLLIKARQSVIDSDS